MHTGDLLPVAVTLFTVSTKYKRVLRSSDAVSHYSQELEIITIPIEDSRNRSFSVPHSTTCTMRKNSYSTPESNVKMMIHQKLSGAQEFCDGHWEGEGRVI